MYQLLIVEDSRDISEPLLQILKEEGFSVTLAETQRAATNALEAPEAAFDLALVDLSLPDGHGFAVFQTAQRYNVPVIFLTANNDEYMTATGLDMGADDYIPKPYRKRELLSRINKVLKARGKMNPEIIFGALRVDTAKGNVYKNGEEIFLSRLEYLHQRGLYNNTERRYRFVRPWRDHRALCLRIICAGNAIRGGYCSR